MDSAFPGSFACLCPRSCASGSSSRGAGRATDAVYAKRQNRFKNYFKIPIQIKGLLFPSISKRDNFKIRKIIDVLQKTGGQTNISVSFILTNRIEEYVGINCYMFHFLWKAFLIRSLVARASSLDTAQTILPLISTAPPYGSWFFSGSYLWPTTSIVILVLQSLVLTLQTEIVFVRVFYQSIATTPKI